MLSSPSIIAIGDDWQSVYAWRGSSPEFFIRFDDFFPVHSELGSASRCQMGENFRSVGAIVADAETLIRKVKRRTEKQVVSKLQEKCGDHGVVTIQMDKFNIDYNAIKECIEKQWQEMTHQSGGDKTKVIVLGRTRKMRDNLSKIVSRSESITFFTFHGAKGLQGEVAILCGDCSSEGIHLLRNRLYKAAGIFKQTYDEVMEDETYRLAYVAVTRGVRRVF